MLQWSPSGALSPYYYKNGFFHGIHYGSYFDKTDELLAMMDKEEEFISKSPEKRRVLIDLYESELSDKVLQRLVLQIKNLRPKIFRLCIICDRKGNHKIRKAFKESGILAALPVYFCNDPEDGKTWLVN